MTEMVRSPSKPAKQPSVSCELSVPLHLHTSRPRRNTNVFITHADGSHVGSSVFLVLRSF